MLPRNPPPLSPAAYIRRSSDGTPRPFSVACIVVCLAGTWTLAAPVAAQIVPAAPPAITMGQGAVFIESVVVDEDGTWYGYYRMEVPAEQCGRPDRALPRIGAARSEDKGESWRDLGIILEAPPGWYDCNTTNQYFVGGVGNVSAMLDHRSKDLYLYFTQYSKPRTAQGVALARLAWADRDAPVGRVSVFYAGSWLGAEATVSDDDNGDMHLDFIYSAGTPRVEVEHPWHDGDAAVDAFWGASVHWNPSLQLYVMLLNRTRDEQFTQEGVYVSFAKRL